MEFLFHGADDKPLFIRDDAERAEWTEHQMTLALSFPYREGKVIRRGMRVGFTDATGAFQYFEIRKAKTYEPDHYQEITAEHIVISELTDDHFNPKYWSSSANQTCAWYLNNILTHSNANSVQAAQTIFLGSLWAVGTDTSDGMLNKITLSRGSTWQMIRSMEDAWNVRIVPRVTHNETGITGRYLDIKPAAGAYRGVRLSLDKNILDANVMIDDTGVVTAMYGYGANDIELYGIGWAETADHPAKPAYQRYLEDPDATAAYGRGGRPRFGFYNNAQIRTQSELIDKTWEALKQAREPRITVDGQVSDLYRMGYADEPLALYDTVYVELRPTGMKYALEVSALTADLLDASNSHITIGKYYPNIIVIDRNTNAAAQGGQYMKLGGSNGSGQSDAESQATDVESALTQLQTLNGYTLGAGTIKDGDGVMQNVILWS